MSADGLVVQKRCNPAENIGKHMKSSYIILRATPIIDNLIQFEEDFNSRTEKSVGMEKSPQTRPIPRSPDGDKKTNR